MKKILIIGATSCIAENCARIWAARGDMLYLVARNKERLEIITTDLKARGNGQSYSQCVNINEIEDHAAIFDAAKSTMGDIDIVLIAHGILSSQKSCELHVEEALADIKTNALTVISFLTIIANFFEEKRAGTIAIISSIAGERGRASNYVYGSAKAMVTTFTSGLRQRLHKFNVDVVTIKPGLIDTPMTASFKKGFLWKKPAFAAVKIVRAIDRRKNEVYVPAFWWLVMMVIKVIPNSIYNKLKL